jgi:hypothetical protein
VSADTQYVIRPSSTMRRGGAYQITLAHSQDWARPWPSEAGASPLFRLATLPIRLAALGLLWATSTPGRLLFAAAVAGAASALIAIN